jgi:hypothetical protein
MPPGSGSGASRSKAPIAGKDVALIRVLPMDDAVPGQVTRDATTENEASHPQAARLCPESRSVRS